MSRAKKPKPLTPEEFTAAMKKAKEENKSAFLARRGIDDVDPEGFHVDADRLMCELLESLGYGEGVAIFHEMDKWYA